MSISDEIYLIKNKNKDKGSILNNKNLSKNLVKLWKKKSQLT